MYRVQRNGQWETCAGEVVAVTETTLTVTDAQGQRQEVALEDVQGWQYDPAKAAKAGKARTP